MFGDTPAHPVIATIAVIGATELGCRVGYASLSAGYRVILEDVSIAVLERGVAAVQGMLQRAYSRTLASSVDPDGKTLATAHSVEEAVREADLIVETVADEMEMKLELFTIFDKFAKPGAVFASTTTAQFISDLAEMTCCPERCVGLRFVGTQKDSGELQIVKGRRTSEETVASCLQVAARMGLKSKVINERAE